jgi:hypothetical protein
LQIKVIQYPLKIVLEGNQYPLAKDLEDIGNPLEDMCYLQKLPIPSGEFVRGLPITSDTLLQICQRIANTLFPSVTNLPEGCQQPMAHLQECCPNCTPRGNLCAIPLKKVKFTVKNKEATDSYLQKLSEVHLQIRLYPFIPPVPDHEKLGS